MVSVVIVSWNRKKETAETIESILSQTYKNFEIIVIDQASTDGAAQFLLEKFPMIKMIKLHKNHGAPGGRNIGAANSNGNILVFIDNDATFNLDALEKVVRKFETETDIGILGFKIVDANTGQLDFKSWPYQKNKIVDLDKEFLTYTFCGAGYAIKKEVLETAGYYWDDLFFAWEEIELSVKVFNLGYKILYFPFVLVNHNTSPEKRTKLQMANYFRLRNSLWVLFKHFPYSVVFPCAVVRIFVYCVKGVKFGGILLILKAAIQGLSRIDLLFSKKRMDKSIYRMYVELSNKGPFLTKIKSLFSRNEFLG
jgi:GT2 family glycosyltransferase